MRQTEEKAAIAAQRRFLQDFAVEFSTTSITFYYSLQIMLPTLILFFKKESYF